MFFCLGSWVTFFIFLQRICLCVDTIFEGCFSSFFSRFAQNHILKIWWFLEMTSSDFVGLVSNFLHWQDSLADCRSVVHSRNICMNTISTTTLYTCKLITRTTNKHVQNRRWAISMLLVYVIAPVGRTVQSPVLCSPSGGGTRVLTVRVGESPA